MLTLKEYLVKDKYLDYFSTFPLDEELLEEEDYNDDPELINDLIYFGNEIFGEDFIYTVKPEEFIDTLVEASQYDGADPLEEAVGKALRQGFQRVLHRVSQLGKQGKGYKKGVSGLIGKTAKNLKQKLSKSRKGLGAKEKSLSLARRKASAKAKSTPGTEVPAIPTKDNTPDTASNLPAKTSKPDVPPKITASPKKKKKKGGKGKVKSFLGNLWRGGKDPNEITSTTPWTGAKGRVSG